MQILLMGGTRFIGVPLIPRLLEQGHSLTVFTRGRQPVPAGVEHVKGDRSQADDLDQLRGRRFDVVIDSSGRRQEETEAVIDRTGPPAHRLVYVSSAGVYADTGIHPLDETSPLDPASRHAGKAETEVWLRREAIPFTSFRPTYIVGPGNYNPIEGWFFDRISHGRPVPVPGTGETITQLGHVEDLAEAMARCLEVDASTNRIYNCSGRRGITFNALIDAAAAACGRDPSSVERRHFDPGDLDLKARKAFPLRMSHFFTDVQRLCSELAWSPRYDVAASLRDSHQRDYSLRQGAAPDFSGDDALFAFS
ncbi:NAD-dependent epimerase/dehydratase family protein [Synechococcus sp. RSCCF101]|uniref:NAD-dependent epimerase/dehydratase family protein n=1 Tax=Synechococcus sp. RSCCF101 TaxID=2511069 RepID=UPI0012443880|nr:NAD-dependent epimerase/dehydratase family protein [Synechococcus sp. RSCCF101]QEY33370.1 NAD-dependent epimerase/dehydratase family protein [Synechococcus sp. RSCCF101]